MTIPREIFELLQVLEQVDEKYRITVLVQINAINGFYTENLIKKPEKKLGNNTKIRRIKEL